MENENINRKDTTKEKVILFVIGVLVGAVVSTAAFFVYVKVLGVGSNTSGTSSQQMPGGTPPEMPSGESGQSGQGQPPAKPGSSSSESGSSSQTNGE